MEDSLVYRYNPKTAANDGLGGGREGTFSRGSFWYVECLARAGDLKQARFIFEKALGCANYLGLYAEQLGPCREQLGNFPQTLSHIALISAAWNLNERLDGQNGLSFPQKVMGDENLSGPFVTELLHLKSGQRCRNHLS